jgi:hypothetical protein
VDGPGSRTVAKGQHRTPRPNAVSSTPIHGPDRRSRVHGPSTRVAARTTRCATSRAGTSLRVWCPDGVTHTARRCPRASLGAVRGAHHNRHRRRAKPPPSLRADASGGAGRSADSVLGGELGAALACYRVSAQRLAPERNVATM